MNLERHKRERHSSDHVKGALILGILWHGLPISLVLAAGIVSSFLLTHKYLRARNFHTNFNLVVNAFNPTI